MSRQRNQGRKPSVPGPVEIADAGYELATGRVAAVDVAKDSGTVCVRMPGKAGRRVSQVQEVQARTGAVIGLGEKLTGPGIEKVTLESTSDYWRIWYYLLEGAGLSVQLVNARDVKNVPGRPKTDRPDAIWLAKLTEKGLLRPSFVPPAGIRQLRAFTRLRVELTRERTRYRQRLEKLPGDALIKVPAVASTLDTLSTRDMTEALIAGERDPKVLARLARGRMKTRHPALVAALDGRFDDHHGELARMLLDQTGNLTRQTDTLSARIEELIGELPAGTIAASEDSATDGHGTGAGGSADGGAAATAGGNHTTGTGCALPVIERLDEIPGIGPKTAQIIIAEIGLDMSRFPTPAHLVPWAKPCPRTVQSGPVTRGGKTGKGNPYLKGAPGEAAAAAARTGTFPGERYRRLVKRCGKLKALVAVARSILRIIWNLLANPAARFHDLGSDYHTSRIDIKRRMRNHVAGLTALGFRVTLEEAAA